MKPELTPEQVEKYFLNARDILSRLGRAGVSEVAQRVGLQPTTVYRFRDGGDVRHSHAKRIAKTVVTLSEEEQQQFRRYRRRKVKPDGTENP